MNIYGSSSYILLSEYISVLMRETFKGIIQAELDEEEKIKELITNIDLPLAEFSNYVSAEEVRQEIVKIFSVNEVSCKSLVDEGMPYIPKIENQEEEPAIFKNIEYKVIEGDYTLDISTKSFVITSTGYKNIFNKVLLNLASKKQNILKTLINRGIPRVLVDNGKINSKVLISLKSNSYKNDCRCADNLTEVQKGIEYIYYECKSNGSPETSLYKAIRRGRTDNFNINLFKNNTNFLVRFVGFIEVMDEGDYTFYLKSSGISRLFIGNKLLVESRELEDGCGKICLKRGKHLIIVNYMNMNKNKFLEVMYSSNQITKKIVPNDVLYYPKNNNEIIKAVNDNQAIHCKSNETIFVKPINISNTKILSSENSCIGEIEINYKIIY